MDLAHAQLNACSAPAEEPMQNRHAAPRSNPGGEYMQLADETFSEL